jgi:hypothetical protein
MGGAFLIAGGLGLALLTLRVLRSPKERWIQGRLRWLVLGSARRGQAPPSASELRLWASVWLAIAACAVGLGVTLIVTA